MADTISKPTVGAVPRCVLLFSRIDFHWLNPILMERMRARFGTRFIVVAPGEKWVSFFEPHCRPGDRIIAAADIWGAAASEPLDEKAALRTALANEEKYGLTYLRDILQQDRSVSAYYLMYAPHSPFTRRRPPPLAELSKEINYYFEYFERLFDQEPIDLVIERPGDLFSTACLHAAQRRGIPTTFWLPARHESNVMWSLGLYLGHDLLHAAYDAAREAKPVPMAELQPPDDSRRNFARADELGSLRYLAIEIYRTSRDFAIWTVQDIARRRRSNRLGYVAGLRHHIAIWRAHRALDRMVESDIDRICERPFVLFLLQYEPEFTTLSLAREFNDTRAVLQQMALAMPSGYRLVIKENVNSIGNRALSFYRNLRRLPNVTLADHRIQGLALAARAAAVATISSTGALEANLLGKPAIIFAAHVEYGFLPDIHQVASLPDLPSVIREAVRERSEREHREIRIRAARYRKALESVSFSAPGTRPFRGTVTTLPEGEADRAVDLLVDCFRAQAPAASVSRKTKSRKTKSRKPKKNADAAT